MRQHVAHHRPQRRDTGLGHLIAILLRQFLKGSQLLRHLTPPTTRLINKKHTYYMHTRYFFRPCALYAISVKLRRPARRTLQIVSTWPSNAVIKTKKQAQKSERHSMTSSNPTGPQELQAARRKGAWLLFWAFIFSIFVNILMLTGPLYMLQVYDRVLSSRSVETLVALSMLVTGLFFLMGVLDYARGRLMARVGARFQTALDGRLFDATLRRSTRPHEQAKSAAAMQDLDVIHRFIASPVLLALFDMPWVPVFIVAIFLFHPMLGWLAVTGGLAIIALALGNQFLTSKSVREAQSAEQEARVFGEMARAGSEVALTQGLRANMQRRFARLRTAAMRQTLRSVDGSGTFASATKTFRMFLQSAMLGAGAYFVIQGEMTPGSMIAGSVLLGRGLAPIEQAMGSWSLLQRARYGWKSLGRYLAEVPAEPVRMELPRPDPALRVKSLTVVAPGNSRPTLTAVNFAIEPGEALGVIGRSGSGKSTMARALAGYWRISAGEVRLGGATLDQYDPDRLGQHIGYLPQMVTLFPGTVAENIARMDLSPDSNAVVQAAKRCNAHDMIMSLPKGYDTYLDGNENMLSGGQRQRVALARALYGDPVLLILDEPNSMLDADGSEALNQTVRDFKASGKSAIIMTHRPAAIAECDRLLVLENGVVTALGPRDEVMARMVKNVEPVRASLQRKAAF
ncbi:type I secretion system permease/ATPase [Arenibacterium sp. CAU 1754]